MSRVFGGGSTDVINCGSDATLDNISTFTYCAWIYPTGYGGGNLGRIFDKGDTAQFFWNMTDAVTGGMRLRVDRNTVNADATAASNTITHNSWQFVACTFNTTDGGKMYKGVPGGVVSEISYSSNTAGSGGKPADAGGTLYVGNAGAATRNFAGRIAEFMGFSANLNVNELTTIMYGGWAKPGSLFIYLPLFGQGSPEPDLSPNANNGTLTGTTAGIHPPALSNRFGRGAGWQGAFSAAGGSFGELAGTFSGSASFSSSLTGFGSLVGAFSSDSSFTSVLTGFGALSGLFSGSADFSSTLTGLGALTGLFSASSDFSGTMAVFGALSGSFAGSSSFSSVLTALGALTGTFDGSSTFSSSLVAYGALSGLFASTSTFSGSFDNPGAMAGSFSGSSSFSSIIAGLGDLRGSFAGVSDFTVSLPGGDTVISKITLSNKQPFLVVINSKSIHAISLS